MLNKLCLMGIKDEEYQSPVDELSSGHNGHINLQELEVIHDLDTTSDSQIETTTIVVDQNCLNEVLKLAQNKVSVNNKGNGKQLLSSPEVCYCIFNVFKTCRIIYGWRKFFSLSNLNWKTYVVLVDIYKQKINCMYTCLNQLI